MSKLTWLHISDLHFRAPQNPSFDLMRQALLRDVNELAAKESLIPDLIFVTGDLAFSGHAKEYDLVQQFFDKLLKTAGVAKDRLFVIPGNHDVDRSAITPGATSIVESLYTRDKVNEFLGSEEDRALVFRKFRHYRDFISDYFGDDKEQYFYVKRLELSGKHIAILGLNSAWASGISRDDRGYALLGERQANEALEASKGADLRLALMHHPPRYLSDSDQYVVQSLLIRRCDFVLHGRLYQSKSAQIYESDVRAMVIGTGLDYEAPDDVDTYNFVQLDFSENKGDIHLRRYTSERGGSWIVDTSTHPEADRGVYAFPLRLDWSPPSEESADSISVSDKIRVNELSLTNFRCFEEESFSFSEKFTVLIGDNASGKTTILDALAVGLGRFFSVMGGRKPPSFAEDDARLVRYRSNESQYPVQLYCRVARGDQKLKWTITQDGPGNPAVNNGREPMELGRSLQSQVQNGFDVVLPLFAYYGTGRLWTPGRPSDDMGPSGSRLRGYENCLNPASHVGDIMGWMKTQELIVLQERKPSRVYEAVKDAIKDCLGNVTEISYNVRADEVSARFSDGRELPFRMFSDGVRNMFAMVADIARRAAILNPQFNEKAPAETPGIVLIDEIDLHLHPSWQRHVVDDLRRTFPRIQFIATTHSPFIIQSLRPGELVDLRKYVAKEYVPGEYVKRSIEDIAEDVMGIKLPQRSERYNEMYKVAEEYYRVLQEADGANSKKKRELKQKLDELIAPFSDNVAYHAFLEAKRIAAGLGEDDNEAS